MQGFGDDELCQLLFEPHACGPTIRFPFTDGMGIVPHSSVDVLSTARDPRRELKTGRIILSGKGAGTVPLP